MRPALYLTVWSTETRKHLSYRGDFWLGTIAGFAVDVAVAWAVWAAVFAERGVGRIGGYSERGMVIYYVAVLLLGRLVRGPERTSSMADDIYQGTLTRYLLYPCSYFACKYAERLGYVVPVLVQLAALSAALLLWVELPPELAIGATSAAAAAVAVALANLLYFLHVYVIEASAFWADNVWTLNVMLRFSTAFLGGLFLPLDLFPDWAQRLLAWTPFPYLFFFPAQSALGRLGPVEWLRGLAVAALWCAILGAVGAAVWRRGHRTYTGVGI